MAKSLKISTVIGISFLLLQLASIIYARFVPERFFCWAPYDEHSQYKINVVIDGMPLSENKVEKRYRYQAEGWEVRSMDNIFSLVKQYESTYGKDDHAKVSIIYTTNGHNQKQWKISN